MPTDFQAGFSNPVKFTPDGAGQTTINITDWSHDELIDLLDTSHSGTAGVEDNIAGLLRAEGTFNADLDLNALPATASTPNLRAGVKGVFLKHVSTGKTIQVPARITRVHYASAVAGKVSWSCSYKLCASAGSYVRAT